VQLEFEIFWVWNRCVVLRVAVIINPQARRIRHRKDFLAEIKALFETEKVTATIVICPSRGMAEWLRAQLQKRPDVLVSAGGDGTTGSIAEACVQEDLPLGVIPAGTHNHFARDLKIPEGMEEAVRCIARGHARRIDVGEVNGRVFINNSSIGAYPRVVEERDELIDRFGLRKSVAQLLATARVCARKPLVRAEIEINGRVERRATPFVFVGNNQYQIHPFEERFRSSLEAGTLCVFTTRRNGIGGFLRLFWLSLFHRLEAAGEFESRLSPTVCIRLTKRMVRVSKDGEILRLETPLHYASRPGALKVLVPPPCAV
jgi:diacylglycerol kinase family enzyme